MKVIILAGGFGTRLGNISKKIPKPMVEIGNKPIVWHIMKIYSHYGFNDFILSLGYKGDVIKEYFYNYHRYTNDFSIDFSNGKIETLEKQEKENWKVKLIDTGLNTLKGARIKRLEKYLDDVNMVTYGDGVANINIKKLLEYHKSHGKLITISGMFPPSRFGEIIEENGIVKSFREKPQMSNGSINGGYMVFNKELLNYLSTDENCDLEYGPFEILTKEEQLMVYKHEGNWECVDNERDLKHLQKLWDEDNAFWKVW